MKAKDIMTKRVVVIPADLNIYNALKIMLANEISGLPVVEESGKLIGIITEKDVLAIHDSSSLKDKKVSSLIVKKVIYVDENTSCDEIRKILLKKKIKRIPILRDGRPIGIVSRRDILKFFIGGIYTYEK
jgi:CBS domain-containing protein